MLKKENVAEAPKMQGIFNVPNKEDLELQIPWLESAWAMFWVKTAQEGFWALFPAHFY